jgi:hypothetical protein
MRRHFSFQRLAIVVVWAALSPQGALLVQGWTGLFGDSAGVDTASVAGDFDSGWNRWSDLLGTVGKQSVAQNTATENATNQNSTNQKPVAERPGAENPVSENSVPDEVAAEATVSRRFLSATFDRLPAESASARAEFPVADDVAARRILGTLPIDIRHDSDL